MKSTSSTTTTTTMMMMMMSWKTKTRTTTTKTTKTTRKKNRTTTSLVSPTKLRPLPAVPLLLLPPLLLALKKRFVPKNHPAPGLAVVPARIHPRVPKHRVGKAPSEHLPRKNRPQWYPAPATMIPTGMKSTAGSGTKLAPNLPPAMTSPNLFPKRQQRSPKTTKAMLPAIAGPAVAGDDVAVAVDAVADAATMHRSVIIPIPNSKVPLPTPTKTTSAKSCSKRTTKT
jgi:hypothetical protein